MSTMTFKEQLRELIDSSDSSIKTSFFRSEIMNVYDLSFEYSSGGEKEFQQEILNSNIIFKHEDSYGGEGMGEEYWSVYAFTKGDETLYVKFDGWYQSYNGSEYTGWFFIEPKQVMVTKYIKS